MKIFKPSTLIPLGIAIAAALLTQPVRATAIQTLLITENSSTDLSAVLNGTTNLTVTPGFAADTWTIALMGISGSAGAGGQNSSGNWVAPAAAGFSNRVSFDSNGPNRLFLLGEFG